MKELQKLQDKIVENSEYKDFDSSILDDFIEEAINLKKHILLLADLKDKNMDLQELNGTKIMMHDLFFCFMTFLNIAYLLEFDIKDLINLTEGYVNAQETVKKYLKDKNHG